MLNVLLTHTVKNLTDQEDEREVWKGKDLKVRKHEIFFTFFQKPKPYGP
jgi:hypothetical protein